jgi:hypothetical protein
MVACPQQTTNNYADQEFSGNIFIFHAFDIGDDINLNKIVATRAIGTVPLQLPKYFKNYHTPLAIELPHPHGSSKNIGCTLYNFGAVSLTYKIPFTDTLENVRKSFDTIYDQYQEQSVIDVKSIFKKIQPCISKPHFFQTRSSYIVLQVDPIPDKITVQKIRQHLGGVITSVLRFETEALSEDQRNEILEGSIGYLRGDLIIIDTEAAVVYDQEYEEILDFFAFTNIQLLELRYFDRLLDQRLNKIYEGEGRKPRLRAYLPLFGTTPHDPVEELGKLKVDISVITERLESSIKVSGEPYFSELYELLVNKLDLLNWRNGIDRKLTIIHDIQSTYQHKIDVIREDMLSVLIVILIFIEAVVGVLGYLK